MIKVSAVITSFNNQDTIVRCVESVSFADEIVLLDSYSTDNTLSLLENLPCTIHQQAFQGYAKQKQGAIDLATHDWVLLLDSDEFLTVEAQRLLSALKQSKPCADAYALPRREWLFWRWSHRLVRMNSFVRFFYRPKAQMSKHLVHESVVSSGRVEPLSAIINHFGETSISVKMEKINRYSQLAAQDKFNKGKKVGVLKVLLYPWWYFFKQCVLRRQVFNGVAGLINAAINSHYAFLKYAKLYELQRKHDNQ